MKSKKYESMTLIRTVIFILFLIVLILVIFSLNKNIRTYKVINSTVFKDDIVEVLVNDRELKMIYDNKYLFLNRKKVLIDIVEINKSVLVRKNKNYHNALLRVKLNKNSKVNDVKSLVLFNRKVNVFEMIRIIWKGE